MASHTPPLPGQCINPCIGYPNCQCGLKNSRVNQAPTERLFTRKEVETLAAIAYYTQDWEAFERALKRIEEAK